MSPAYAARHRHRPPDARRSPAAGARLHYTLTRLWTRTASVRGKTRATRPACQRPQALHADPGPGALALHAWLMYANRKFARSPIRIPQNCDQNAISRSTQRRIFILKVCSDVSRYISIDGVVDISNFDYIRDRDAAGGLQPGKVAKMYTRTVWVPTRAVCVFLTCWGRTNHLCGPTQARARSSVDRTQRRTVFVGDETVLKIAFKFKVVDQKHFGSRFISIQPRPPGTSCSHRHLN